MAYAARLSKRRIGIKPIKPIKQATRRCVQSGAAVIVVLTISALLLIVSAVSLDTFLMSIRSARRSIESTRDFHAVDAALMLCERALQPVMPLRDTSPDGPRHQDRAQTSFDALSRLMSTTPEPGAWRNGIAVSVGRRGVQAIQVPRDGGMVLPCLIETWIDHPAWGRVSLLTARMPASDARLAHQGPGIWLQSIVVRTAFGDKRHWRVIAEPPAP